MQREAKCKKLVSEGPDPRAAASQGRPLPHGRGSERTVASRRRMCQGVAPAAAALTAATIMVQ